MRIGIVGVGVIAEAFVKALKDKYENGVEVWLSPRNAARAAALQLAYDGVRVAANNQEVLDNSEWIIISVLPEDVDGVLAALTFRDDHRVISLASEPRFDDLSARLGKCRSLVRVMPLPFIEFRIGPITMYPHNPETEDLLRGLGTMVVTENEEEFIYLQVLSSAMGSFYFLVDSLVEWAQGHGLSRRQSASFLFSMFGALSFQGEKTKETELSRLWQEMTPGGLNETVTRSIKNKEGFACWLDAMEEILRRIS